MKLFDTLQALRLILKTHKHLRCVESQLESINYEKILNQGPVIEISTKASIKAIVKSYFWASRLIKDGHCLPRSIALYQGLKSLGYDVEHKFGVNKKDNKLAAHAWVEYQGKPLNEPIDLKKRFTVLEKSNESLK